MTICLEDDIDISRGDMLVGFENLPGIEFGSARAKFAGCIRSRCSRAKNISSSTPRKPCNAVVTSIESKIRLSTFESDPNPPELAMNDIGTIRLKTAKPLVFDGYATNRLTGSFILIEQGTNATVAPECFRLRPKP